jgi:hypothetical protein
VRPLAQSEEQFVSRFRLSGTTNRVPPQKQKTWRRPSSIPTTPAGSFSSPSISSYPGVDDAAHTPGMTGPASCSSCDVVAPKFVIVKLCDDIRIDAVQGQLTNFEFFMVIFSVAKMCAAAKCQR